MNHLSNDLRLPRGPAQADKAVDSDVHGHFVTERRPHGNSDRVLALPGPCMNLVQVTGAGPQLMDGVGKIMMVEQFQKSVHRVPPASGTMLQWTTMSYAAR